MLFVSLWRSVGLYHFLNESKDSLLNRSCIFLLCIFVKRSKYTESCIQVSVFPAPRMLTEYEKADDIVNILSFAGISSHLNAISNIQRG